ncbi:hypothetical protein EDD86DRAFT_199814 [Gorgonomyces haynaldii]|nr:hypothetical protein EDD86DRAFT_199814 [Gorgonomyces haynaldii]
MPDVAPPVVSNADDTPLKDKEGDVSSVDDTPLKAMEPLKAKDTIPVKAEPELMNTKQHAFNQRKETQEVPNPRLQRSHATSQGNLLKDSPKPARQLKSAVSHSTLAPIKPSGGSKMGSPNPEKRDMGHLQRPTSSQLKKANSSTLLPSIGKTSRPNSALSVEEDPETRTKREVAEYLDHLRLTMDPKYGSPRGYKNIKGSQLDLRKTHQSNSRLHSLEK